MIFLYNNTEMLKFCLRLSITRKFYHKNQSCVNAHTPLKVIRDLSFSAPDCLWNLILPPAHSVGYNSASVRCALVLIFKNQCYTSILNVKYWSYLHHLSYFKNDTTDLFFSETVRKLNLMTLHQMWHLNATLLLNSGVDLKIVSEHLGHSDIGITANIYADVLKSTKAIVADFIALKLTYKRINNKNLPAVTGRLIMQYLVVQKLSKCNLQTLEST